MAVGLRVAAPPVAGRRTHTHWLAVPPGAGLRRTCHRCSYWGLEVKDQTFKHVSSLINTTFYTIKKSQRATHYVLVYANCCHGDGFRVRALAVRTTPLFSCTLIGRNLWCNELICIHPWYSF